MPRRARMYLPDLPYHIVQRGNNREACFIEFENYQFYLELWQALSAHYGVAIHTYYLMTNHIHFLVTPRDETAISNTMKVAGSRYAQHINKTYRRTGTLWEGRHRCSLVQSNRYLLTCRRYIELNPVRANMVVRPEEYRWSSYGANAWGDNSFLRAHEQYRCLGKTKQERCYAYRELFKHHLSPADLHLIRKSAHYCQPVGDERFRERIEQQYNVKLGHMKRGRPKKKERGVINI